jgi:hypothetical protein
MNYIVFQFAHPKGIIGWFVGKTMVIKTKEQWLSDVNR